MNGLSAHRFIEKIEVLARGIEAIENALTLLERDRDTLIECSSLLRLNASGEPETIPDTVEACAIPEVALYQGAIRGLRTFLKAIEKEGSQ